MNKRKYIILRDLQRAMLPQFPVVGRMRGHGRRDRDAPVATVEVEEISRAELGRLVRDPTVAAAVPAMPVKLARPVSRSDDPTPASSSGTTWGVETVGAVDTRYTGAGTKVGILDTGIDAQHEAFQGVRIESRNYTGEVATDTDGHGTHCAATIFGRTVAGKRIGVAPGVTQVFVAKVLGSGGGGSDQVVRALMDAVNAGCQVISMSLGIDFPGYAQWLIEDKGVPPDLANALAIADYRANVRLFDRIGEFVAAHAQFHDTNVALIAASGNESRRDIDPNHEFPAAPPSEAEGFISVGAVRRTGTTYAIADFSNTGCTVCAPGVAVLSAKAGTKDGLVAFSGTSMAAPHVAGVAALWLEHLRVQPGSGGVFRQAGQLRARLVGTADARPLATGYDPYDAGAGIVRAPGGA